MTIKHVIHAKGTGTCFDDCVAFIKQKLIEDPSRVRTSEFLICHGICLHREGPRKDKPYAHGWVEQGDTVWISLQLDGEMVFAQVEKKEFYEDSRVQDVTRYTLLEAAHLEMTLGRTGPWKKEYIALTIEGLAEALIAETLSAPVIERMRQRLSPDAAALDLKLIDEHGKYEATFRLCRWEANGELIGISRADAELFVALLKLQERKGS